MKPKHTSHILGPCCLPCGVALVYRDLEAALPEDRETVAKSIEDLGPFIWVCFRAEEKEFLCILCKKICKDVLSDVCRYAAISASEAN